MLTTHELFGSYELAVLIKMFLAAMAGGLIGLEREKHGRPAGLRTHLLVAVGACLMMIVSEAFYLKYGALEADMTAVRVDPARIAAQIVTGIGFIGAGVIIKEGMSVRGLTTAASLWLVAGLGMAFGAGLIWPGMVAVSVALFGLVILKRFEQVLQKDRYLHLTVSADMKPDIYADLERVLRGKGAKIYDFGTTLDLTKDTVFYRLTITLQSAPIGKELVAAVAEIPGVKKITWE